MALKALVVDDEKLIVKGLRFSLMQDNYEVDCAYDGEEALEMARNGQYDIILLDVMLPRLTGLEVLQQIREFSQVPVIMLTAKGEDMDKIMGLDYGADDYITKPFNILEVKARIKSIFRRTSMGEEQDESKVLRIRDLTINMQKKSATIRGTPLKLTSKEYDLLKLLVTNRGEVYGRERLLHSVWRYDYSGDVRTVDVHIRRLREKIEVDSARPEYILTKWGVGYYFTDRD